jgi:predicted alpha-1,2-mannosidase
MIGTRRPIVVRLVIVVLVVLTLVGVGLDEVGVAAHGAAAQVSSSRPSELVDPFVGTGVGGSAIGDINTFPAADVPFGMVQWGPDTSPDRAAGGGYHFGDTALSGFSLTHLSGPGCAIYGDVPVLPIVTDVAGAPADLTAGFSHSSETATPGRYGVTLDSGVRVDLSVTTHTGLGRFTFPPAAAANVVLKVSDSAARAFGSEVRIVGTTEVVGSVQSGRFCDGPGMYKLYFVAHFDRPFTRFGTWRGSELEWGTRARTSPRTGAVVSFDTRRRRTVGMKVGISFVSVANARRNLDAESANWSVERVARDASARWNRILGRISVEGGSDAERRTFYTALYHSLLHPNVFSDVNGDYVGFDGRTHRAQGFTQYANFSGWDIYRSEIPLQAMLAPHETSDMVRSLLNDANQSRFLPKWPLANVDTAQINGDSAAPIIAAAYAFGARGFDARAALRAMVKSATTKGKDPGWDVARQDLKPYLEQGWIPADRRDRTSLDYTVGGSETLEYAIDDYAISRLATALGERATAATFTKRAANWKNLFNPATGYLAARRADGSFPTGPPFQVSPEPGIGQDGWEEGNSIQYTWSVPQDLRGLFDAMGGNGVAVARLDTFFTKLNTSRKEPYSWVGNEPGLGIPWAYDYAGAPWRTQDVVRRIVTELYTPTPNGEPGNDDLGAMSSWYVWAAMGMYPETPGRAELVLASPLFPRITIALAGKHEIVITAPGASATSRYVHGLEFEGFDAPHLCTRATKGYECPWLPASILRTGGRLHFTLATEPDTKWGSDVAAAPPSMTRH